MSKLWPTIAEPSPMLLGMAVAFGAVALAGATIGVSPSAALALTMVTAGGAAATWGYEVAVLQGDSA